MVSNNGNNLPCIHAEHGLCPLCRRDCAADPQAFLEYGDHPAGQERWQALLEELRQEEREDPEDGAMHILSPQQQIANVQSCLHELRATRPHPWRAEAIRQVEQQLREMEEKHAKGELDPLVDDGLPF
jgi:hypothetical protein